MTTRQLIGFLGSALLFLGVFLPIVKLPIVGDLNYFANGRGDGVLVLVLAVISLLRALPLVSGVVDHGVGRGGCFSFHLVQLPVENEGAADTDAN
jgi:hypothetical protein